MQAAINHSALINQPNIESIFDMLDINGDGYIDQAELKENFKVAEGEDDTMVLEIIQEVDLDKDGMISQVEFSSGMQQMLIKTFNNN